MKNIGNRAIELNNNSFVNIDFVAETMRDMLENKAIIYNGRSLDSYEVDEALNFLIEEMRKTFSVIKETMIENEIRIEDNIKLDLRKEMDDDKLHEILTKLEECDKRKVSVELGLDKYSLGDREDFMNKAMVIYLVKYCEAKTVSDILVFGEELDYNITNKTLLRYVDELEEEGIVEVCLDGELEVLRYVGMDHLDDPCVPEYVNVLVDEIKAMGYAELIRECEDMKVNRHTCCDRFLLIYNEIVSRRSEFLKEHCKSLMEMGIETCERVYLDSDICDDEVLSIALDLIDAFSKYSDCTDGEARSLVCKESNNTIAEEFSILRNDIIEGRVDKDSVLDRVNDIKIRCV